MNERIKQLAWESANGMLSYDADGDWLLSGKEAERFAELIIRQCAYEADLFAALGCPSDMDPEKTGVGDYIKNVFGVKE